MSYASQAATALAAIKAKGTLMQMWLPPQAGDFDPVTDTDAVPLHAQPVPVMALILAGPRDPNLGVAAGALERYNTRKLLIAGASVPVAEVPPGTVFRFEGHNWAAKGGTRLAPDGGDAILHTVIVAR